MQSPLFKLSRDLVNFRELSENSPLPRAERLARDTALLGVRLVALCLGLAGPDDLVYEHVATIIVALTRAGIVLYAQLMSEPMIMDAALVEMVHVHRVENAPRRPLEASESGGVDEVFSAGDTGEFVASKMLQPTYGRVIRQMIPASAPMPYIGAPFSVGAFLRGLLKRAQLAKVLETGFDELLGFFAFTLQAIPIVERVTREWIILTFKRRCAIICEKGAYGVDIVISIVLLGKRERSPGTLKTSNISGIFVEVRK